jgi:hypothetical protein
MNALATHFTFGDQWRLEKTDLLKRYHAYALEMPVRGKSRVVLFEHFSFEFFSRISRAVVL